MTSHVVLIVAAASFLLATVGLGIRGRVRRPDALLRRTRALD